MPDQCYWDQRLDRILRHLPQSDDITLIALKGHLLIEEILGDLIRVKCREPEALEKVDISFFLKARLARALVSSKLRTGFEIPAHTWEMIDALNSLRNELAHSLDSPAVDRKLERLISLAFKTVRKPESVSTRAQELRMAISILHAIMSSFEAAVSRNRRRRASA